MYYESCDYLNVGQTKLHYISLAADALFSLCPSLCAVSYMFKGLKKMPNISFDLSLCLHLHCLLSFQIRLSAKLL